MILMTEEEEEGKREIRGKKGGGLVHWIRTSDESCVFYYPSFVSSVILGIYLSCLNFKIYSLSIKLDRRTR